jgi:hypothetical protein
MSTRTEILYRLAHAGMEDGTAAELATILADHETRLPAKVEPAPVATCDGKRQAAPHQHGENCDTLQPGPDLGPSTKPCNCQHGERRTVAGEPRDAPNVQWIEGYLSSRAAREASQRPADPAKGEQPAPAEPKPEPTSETPALDALFNGDTKSRLWATTEEQVHQVGEAEGDIMKKREEIEQMLREAGTYTRAASALAGILSDFEKDAMDWRSHYYSACRGRTEVRKQAEAYKFDLDRLTEIATRGTPHAGTEYDAIRERLAQADYEAACLYTIATAVGTWRPDASVDAHEIVKKFEAYERALSAFRAAE